MGKSTSPATATLKRMGSMGTAAPKSKKKQRVLARANKRGSLIREQVFALILDYNAGYDVDYSMMRSTALASKVLYKNVRSTALWRAAALRLHKTLHGHIAPVNVLTKFGAWVFTGSADGKIKVWNSTSWMCERTLNCSPLPQPHMVNSAKGSVSQGKPAIKGADAASRANNAARGRGRGRGRTETSRLTAAVTPPANQVGEQVIAVTALAAHDKILLVGLQNGYLWIRMIYEPKDGSQENRKVSELYYSNVLV